MCDNLLFVTNINRIRVSLTGPAVTGGGVATHYWLGTATATDVAAFKTFWTTLAGQCPVGLTATIPNEGEVLDDNDGTIVSSWSVGVPGSAVGAGATGYAQGVGARIVWQTAGLAGGRHVRGTTYVVPMLASAWESDGTMRGVVVDALLSAGTALTGALGAGRMVILTRRTADHSGTSHAVTGVVVPDKASWLRSRRT